MNWALAGSSNGLAPYRQQAITCTKDALVQLLLTHWGRVTHICISKLTIIGSDNGLSPGRRQAIIWTNAGILLIGALGTNVSEILIKICIFSLRKMLLKMSSGKRPPTCLGLNMLIGSRGTYFCDSWNKIQHYDFVNANGGHLVSATIC